MASSFPEESQLLVDPPQVLRYLLPFTEQRPPSSCGDNPNRLKEDDDSARESIIISRGQEIIMPVLQSATVDAGHPQTAPGISKGEERSSRAGKTRRGRITPSQRAECLTRTRLPKANVSDRIYQPPGKASQRLRFLDYGRPIKLPRLASSSPRREVSITLL